MPEEFNFPGGDVPPYVIERIAQLIRAGEVVILPTDTIYGLHCDAANTKAVDEIFDLKARDKRKPLIVLAHDIDQLRQVGVEMSAQLETMLSSIWPAPLTAILTLRGDLAASGGAPTVAVRIPAVQWLRELIRRTGAIASTSVNVSGRPPVYNTKSIERNMRNRVAAVLDTGPLEAQASTVVDFTGSEPRLVREGEFGFTQELWKRSRKSL
jgi:tRNA threonylcarbamoyl adenosine modification protein (Sua5/YciO/YrdC/YwlC family)